MKAIFIVAWHSKYNPWASLFEREIAKNIAIKLRMKLLNKWLEIFLIWIEDISIQDKIIKVNDVCKEYWYTYKNSLLIEIHSNSTKNPNTWTWTEALIWNWYQEAENIANILLKNTTKLNWLKNRWVKNWLWTRIIKETIPTSIIYETAFINTKEDLKVLTSDLNSFSDWLYNWLKEYIGFDDDIDEEVKLKSENYLLKERIVLLENNLNKINSLSIT